ncbi:rhodanese-related sulfurtransferase [Breznakia sp. PF5-3]|uniref:rhodanese-like domain-containing protein n=1 Tax=unclassified Breznakia TaxID=2623764 RepID=UPI0024054BBB|nr:MULTISPECIES: rhodanese-like domain-containing protein [unclassified Breznakia]MDL2276232.1 rhodanese-like domain-containing protein [Breznakia sp. OttesenSCG-928-G09]MDF9824890.1 rhodanese-related sulfurtransferase [Breznakia sp. PM6-1]MDF9835611.1 rhodanese-related sulfurtransferase [Breznakia sp. PF5-3]MDF9837973.1 rhodanese-related sulfurtransferase [Breznakia sp. PFB2-8]MDF9859962.1 rhodanese-related sulfurtransferase [Breznakia sp. PH5-24]
MFNKNEEIYVRELIEKLKEKPLIVDVREPDEYQGGHIPSSINIPLGQIDYYEPPEEVFLVCHSGRRSRAAALILKDKGYSARSVSGGLLKWNGPLEEVNGDNDTLNKMTL